ncbi:MAG: helix-turn-helix domain-containing protein [Bacteroidetes bacterium]|nr:helix-turn-helix domain-containing protein [Bacteroidota bacterium]
MKEIVSTREMATPMLFPFEPGQFWASMRALIREEINSIKTEKGPTSGFFETPGLTHKPLFKIAEVCVLFQVTKPTIYDWIKHGKLKPVKIRSRVYFLAQDIQQLLHNDTSGHGDNNISSD